MPRCARHERGKAAAQSIGLCPVPRYVSHFDVVGTLQGASSAFGGFEQLARLLPAEPSYYLSLGH